MPSKCPPAPPATSKKLDLQSFQLPIGTELHRFHGAKFTVDTFNPNTGLQIQIPEKGARFNPFPGAPAANVGTLYAADNPEAAALESVFHNVDHTPTPQFPRIQLKEWLYGRLEVTRDLTLFRLTNPELRHLVVAGRDRSLEEGELIHTYAEEYPNTRSWARYLHDLKPDLDGLTWRPRLAGAGSAFVFFGDRCGSGAIKAKSPSTSAHNGTGLSIVESAATRASIILVDGR
jgi:hypothetical protein